MLQVLKFYRVHLSLKFMNSIFFAGMTKEEGFYSPSFYCCSLFSQSTGLLPKLPPSFSVPGFPLQQPATGLCLAWAFPGNITWSWFSGSGESNSPLCLAACPAAAICRKLEPKEKPFRIWKKVPSTLVPLLLAQHLTSLLLKLFSCLPLENHLLFCQGFQPSFLQ